MEERSRWSTIRKPDVLVPAPTAVLAAVPAAVIVVARVLAARLAPRVVLRAVAARQHQSAPNARASRSLDRQVAAAAARAVLTGKRFPISRPFSGVSFSENLVLLQDPQKRSLHRHVVAPALRLRRDPRRIREAPRQWTTLETTRTRCPVLSNSK